MNYTVRKQTYSDGQAYRYHISDAAGELRYVAERSGLFLPSPTDMVEFFDPDHNLSGRLLPPDAAPWQREGRYEIFVDAEKERPYAVIDKAWRLVDILLLRLPRYKVQLGRHHYIVQGSRYGEHFYEIFRLHEKSEDRVEEEQSQTEEVKVGRIQRSTAGPSYIAEVTVAPLRQSLLALAAVVILIDVDLYS